MTLKLTYDLKYWFSRSNLWKLWMYSLAGSGKPPTPQMWRLCKCQVLPISCVVDSQELYGGHLKVKYGQSVWWTVQCFPEDMRWTDKCHRA